MIKKYKYIKHIDSLRGIAIISVIFYHLKLFKINGGFLGVDIFFAISGYLITKILIENNFNFLNFYKNRIRRILPALLFMLLIVTPIFYFLDKDYLNLKEISKSVISVIFFYSNFYYKSRTDYFDDQIYTRPLLHTWSLSIEEQFYIFFPFFLFFFIIFFKKKNVIFFLVIIFINIILVQMGGNINLNYPYVDNKITFFNQSIFFDFFSPLSRIWEFLLGSMAYIYKDRVNLKNNKNKNLIIIFGYFLIFYSIIYFDDNIFYPNILTLVPIFGTLIIIVLENEKSITYKFITNKIILKIGLMSYSLYIWHYPILSISKYYNYEFLNLFYGKILLLIIFTITSFVSYKFIETPFRNKKIINFKNTCIFLLLAILANGLIAHLINSSKNKEKSYKELFSNYSFKDTYTNDPIKSEAEEKSKRNKIINDIQNKKNDSSKKNIIIVGDSHAEDLAMIFYHNYEFYNNYNFKVISARLYTLGNQTLENKERQKKFFEDISVLSSDFIIISNRLFPYKTFQDIEYAFKGYQYIEKEFKSKKKIILFNNSPEFLGNYDPVKSIILSKKNYVPENNLQNLIFKNISVNLFNLNYKINEFSINNSINLIDIFEIFCRKDLEICIYKDDNDKMLFRDSNHLTVSGAKYIANNSNIIRMVMNYLN
jgi:peptidoglycan/LPS O-acetylase OafA/YrhL